ncbi:DinB family protein [Luedemannella helvata]|uniref:DinB family protein n=1 Tax=Luedemannella helvata TaxID=349315 RepID=A0ABP4XB78_9ACTN
MISARDDIIGTSDYVSGRLRERLTGLTDDEYAWEPVPNCRTVRPVGEGLFRSDGPRVDDDDPREFTTLSWRLAHIIDLLTAERIADWLGIQGIPTWPDIGAPGTAADALERFGLALRHWHSVLAATTEESLVVPLGPAAGPYAEATRRAFVLHILDELIHHGAEVAMMRDLYAATGGQALR